MWNWCSNSKHFQNDFNNWTSGNAEKWIDGFIREWDIENQQWRRVWKDDEVELKKFDNFVNFNDVLIRDLITQDPETHSYMMVLEYAKDRNLREYLKINFTADVYLFEIIAYEMIMGFPPYLDILHDKDLAMKICNGNGYNQKLHFILQN
ncbi:hypothetical protein Glove_328g34 [Diversispora epigaea]|uniref:Protein kinase domain-containing protein n=1 Tax=Diversispora epigaea TaxID=1348612 RepID=A0A397HQV2_9GLOM|nr:hypothetical protein Glove_328g34 [Diversispora epigaea]